MLYALYGSVRGFKVMIRKPHGVLITVAFRFDFEYCGFDFHRIKGFHK